MQLCQGDCLEIMKEIPDGSVDMVLCDLPYGITAAKWDSVVPLIPLWRAYHRIVKENGAIVLFCKQPFTTKLISSNYKDYRYNLIWKKDSIDNPLWAKKKFLNRTEDIAIFYRKQPTYNPQGTKKISKVCKGRSGRGELAMNASSRKRWEGKTYIQEYTNYPSNILEFRRDRPVIHQTQKPVALLEYLIRTFTNEGELVLDNTMGSGSTGVACAKCGRNFIGIEKDPEIFKTAKKRLEC